MTALELIKQFEGCVLVAYKDQRGVWTIGYGHTAGVKAGDVITQGQAEAFLSQDLGRVERSMSTLLPFDATANQVTACTSLAFNIGLGAFGSSTLLRKFNAGDIAGTVDEFLKWDHVDGGVNAGLLRRRQAERALFVS